MDLLNGGAQENSASAIDRVIAESRQDNVASIGPPRRKLSMRAGGRPRKGGAPNRATIQKMQQMMASNPTADPQAAASVGVPSGGVVDVGDPQEDAIEFTPEQIAGAIQLPYELAARKTGFDGFRLDDKTALSLAPQIDKCLKQYCPQLKSEHAPLIMVCTTLVITTSMKLAAHARWKAEQSRPPESRSDGVQTGLSDLRSRPA